MEPLTTVKNRKQPKKPCPRPAQELERSVYDLVLMDVHMPVVDGLEAARRIRDLYPPEQRPKIVALSADTTQVRCTASFGRVRCHHMLRAPPTAAAACLLHDCLGSAPFMG